MAASGDKTATNVLGNKAEKGSSGKSKFKGVPPINADLMHPNYLKKDLDHIEERQSDLEGSQGTSRALSHMHPSSSSIQAYNKKVKKL